MSSHLQAVREKIIEAVPEIIELKFGCEFKMKDDDAVYLYGGDSHYFEIGNDTTHRHFYEEDVNKILGRPIRLSDVLASICEETAEFMPHISRTTMRFYYKRLGCFVWDLADDNLDHQSPDTIDFLHSLLIK